MMIQCGSWQIRPYKSGCCWQLWRLAPGKDGAEEWRAQECYPSTLESALDMLLERALREGNEVVGAKEAAERVRREKRSLAAQAAAWKEAGHAGLQV